MKSHKVKRRLYKYTAGCGNIHASSSCSLDRLPRHPRSRPPVPLVGRVGGTHGTKKQYRVPDALCSAAASRPSGVTVTRLGWDRSHVTHRCTSQSSRQRPVLCADSSILCCGVQAFQAGSRLRDSPPATVLCGLHCSMVAQKHIRTVMLHNAHNA
jgi:hypothetical protein